MYIVKRKNIQEQQNLTNQSVENADVEFVGGANERNELFEKKNR